MAKMSKEYWEKRQHERESKAYSSILEVEKEYKEALERAKIDINKQISHIGTTYMKDNQLSHAEAMKQLKGSEYKVWRKQLDEYMQEWKQLKRTAPMEAKKLWLEIETLSARSRISRLDSIRTQIDIELSKVSTEAVESTRKALYGVYGDTYKEVVKDLGIKSMFSDSMVKAVIARPWSGANYSNRIWGNSEKLARVLKQEVTTGMIQRINLKKMGKRISDRIEGAKKNDVERLLRTEVNYTMNQATLDGYKDAKIEKYTFDATLDSRTSQICAELNGETFELSKAAVGVNYPPMHPRCRSTTTPVIDFEALGKQLQRKEESDKLTEEEFLAVRKYIGGQSYALNESLRNRRELSDDYKQWSRDLDKALDKMPKYQGEVTRSIGFFGQKEQLKEFLQIHKVGEDVEYPAYTSTTKGEIYNPDADILVKIKSKSGRDISSMNKEEQEIVYPRNSKFTVVNFKVNYGKYEIEMEEKDE
ncbi:minor capsid protein [Fusobacterium necrophorum]|uniref:Minor capsid protein n=1 Tax=Fusobacterium necrophorum TaxID=859 RepID=A0AAW6WED1_9FUSO|nr:minor capsid protein [Fusobacterium necrophorum]MDK4481731.1 minor capsid protein [Fusobacterium necrophorum]MDK4512850.1 minor capsid protein [Fusobacterium necrophorum]MDK4515675.1 minor capsid protein [Fusobacterium necrophorum]